MVADRDRAITELGVDIGEGSFGKPLRPGIVYVGIHGSDRGWEEERYKIKSRLLRT